MNVFERYAPFIQDYIYRSGWQALRGVPTITGCDAHYLEQISDTGQFMEVPARSREAVLAWLRRGGA